MIELRKHLKLTPELISAPNLVPLMDPEDVVDIGLKVKEEFDMDKNSRSDWEERMDRALKLTMQVTEMKTFPWQGAANVKFPLVTIASIQYSSRAYPALVNGSMPVSCAPVLPRPNPKFPPGLQQQAQQNPQAQQALQKMMQQAQQQLAQYNAMNDRAKRIAYHMSYQILEEDCTWEENQDRALFIQAIMGCVFKKTYFDPIKGHNISECVNPRELVVSYYTKDIETSVRVTHVIYLSSNDCYERAARGLFVDVVSEGYESDPNPMLVNRDNQVQDQRQGIYRDIRDTDAPYECLEQHRYLDLDGDGYAEPYVVTVRYDTAQVLRIVALYTRRDITWDSNGKVIRICPIQCFTKYDFIPSPDGGFYGLGFGALLGPINETVDSAINQMLDATTMATAGGGFLGRGFRNKKGEYRFRPGEWKTVDSTGDDLRKNVMPLPTPQPSAQMFQLLSLMIEYAEQIAGATDILQGKNPGQNTPAETSRAMVEQGMKVFNGIYKRTHRAFTQELRKMYRLNTIYITGDDNYVGKRNPFTKMMARDYQGSDTLLIRPAADPFYMSDAQRYNQAMSMKEASMSAPGYNIYEVNHYLLEALKVPNIDRFLPDPQGPYAVPPPPNPKLMIENIKAQTKQADSQLKYKLGLLKLAQSAEKVAAEIKELEAKSTLELAQAKGVDQGHMIALLDAQIAAKRDQLSGMTDILKLLHDLSGGDEQGSEDGSKGNGPGGGQGMAQPSGNPAATTAIANAAGGIAGQMGFGGVPQR